VTTPPVALGATLLARRDAGHKLLIPYVTGGLGSQWLDVVRAYVDAGADAIEVGIPFSDPVMDGPTIQEASDRALTLGATPMSILSDLRRLDVDVPLVAMTYFNIAFHAGVERFAAELVAAGVGGIVLPDLPLEELGEWSPAGDAAGIETVQLASPITPDDRLVTLCDRTQGFIYGVNLLGVTGERDKLAATSVVLAKRLKAVTDKPVIMGFGVSTVAHAREATVDADGVIVASRLMRLLLDGGSPAELGGFVRELRRALDS
jgi:tryptophan synthase alpha chain